MVGRDLVSAAFLPAAIEPSSQRAAKGIPWALAAGWAERRDGTQAVIPAAVDAKCIQQRQGIGMRGPQINRRPALLRR
jgi:hypothetical protein